MIKEALIEKLYQTIKIPYQFLFKKKEPWNLKRNDFLKLPTNSLGFHYGCFLIQYGFEVQETLEEHDVFHILTKTGIEVLDEINLQFILLGNGKKSLFVLIVVSTGIVFYPHKINEFVSNYKRGKKAHQFYDLNFKKILHLPILEIQKTFNIK